MYTEHKHSGGIKLAKQSEPNNFGLPCTLYKYESKIKWYKVIYCTYGQYKVEYNSLGGQ